MLIAPNTIIGTLTGNIPAGAISGIPVSQTVIDNTAIGFCLEFVDGGSTATNNVGRVIAVIAIDTDNNEITIETATTQGFTAASPTYVRQTVEMIPNYVIGDAKIGGSYLPANTTVRVEYTNNNGSTGYFYPKIEYLY